MNQTLKIATRQSPLALWQAEHVQQRLAACHPHLAVELVPMSTLGDRWQQTPLAEIGGKNHFVKELEQAMLDGAADIAVHSMKDVASDLPTGFTIAAVLERESPFDVLVSNRYRTLDDLPEDAIIGTCSPRRIAQLRFHQPSWTIRNLRGNVNTRLGKLDDGQYDAIILAAAGLERLGLTQRIASVLPVDICLPAVGQGVIGIECHAQRESVVSTLTAIEHTDTRLRLEAERAFCKRLHGGCSAPIAAYCTLSDGKLHMSGRVIALDGSELLEDTATTAATAEQAYRMGTEMAERLIQRGASEILAEAEAIYARGASAEPHAAT